MDIMLSATPVLDGVYQGVLVAFLLLFRITVANTLTAYALMVFAVLLIIWLILGSWGLIRSQLKLRELIILTRNLVQGNEKAVG
jgi:hypothetical protein